MFRHSIQTGTIFILLTVLAEVVLDAQPQDKLFPVRGVVVDQSGAAIQGAEVKFTGEAGTVESLTDTEGNVSVNLPPGRYLVSVRSRGFKTVELHDFAVFGPGASTFHIALEVRQYPDNAPSFGELVETPLALSELPDATIKYEPPPAASAVPAVQAPPAKRRSIRCFYLWRCSSSQ